MTEVLAVYESTLDDLLAVKFMAGYKDSIEFHLTGLGWYCRTWKQVAAVR